MEQELEGEGGSQMATRDYLNGLVAAAAADTDQQVRKQKTGQTDGIYVAEVCKCICLVIVLDI